MLELAKPSLGQYFDFIFSNLLTNQIFNKINLKNPLFLVNITTVIQSELEEGTRAGAQGTPYSVILKSGKAVDVINGAQPYETVKAAIEKALR